MCVAKLLDEISDHFDRLRPQTLRQPLPGQLIEYPYGVPAGFYDQLWDWDGFFIAEHLACRPVQPRPEYFRYWVMNFVNAYRKLGYAPGCLMTDRPETERRGFSLKPLLAQAAWRATGGGRDVTPPPSSEVIKWLASEYNEIVTIVRRREQTHQDESTGLFFWDDAMQSGADNNPALSNQTSLQRSFLACDINAFQHLEYQSLARIAGMLGDCRQSESFDRAATEIQQAMQKHLWNAALGSFDNRRRDTGAFVSTVTYSNFVPLWANLATPDQAKSMVDRHLMNEDHLLSCWGGRSLSRQDRHYNNANVIIPHSNWCGPVWPIANYFYFCGLQNYGFSDYARELACRIAKLVLADLEKNGSMHENYCAETGQPLAPSKDHAPRFIEGGFIGWNLLVQDMLERSQDC